jgi:orotidine-5'-phosphate decarboxylase
MSCQHVADRLLAVSERTASIACVGLDPRPALIPPSLREDCLDLYGNTPQAVGIAFLRFNQAILHAIAGHCLAVKPQLACYEAYGSAGIRALEETVSLAHQLDIPVIADGKRNDIGSTAAHYRHAYLDWAPGLSAESRLPGLCAEWLTTNAYLGWDGIEPLLGSSPGNGGVFVLVKTSNPSSVELQNWPETGPTLMHRMAELVHTWGSTRGGKNGLSDIGAVVGATWPEEARGLREAMPDSWFLVPGYGAQGGGATDALAGVRPAGNGVIVNSSRGIIGAWQQADTADFAAAARAALDAMNQDLNAAR